MNFHLIILVLNEWDGHITYVRGCVPDFGKRGCEQHAIDVDGSGLIVKTKYCWCDEDDCNGLI